MAYLPSPEVKGGAQTLAEAQCAYKAMPVRNVNSYKMITNLKEHWLTEIADLVSGVPPLRLINHKINLINPAKHIHYRLPKFPRHTES